MSVESDTGVLIPPISTPDSSTHEIPRSFVERVREDICYKCQNKGHWARDCPSKSLNRPAHHTNSNSAETHCLDFPALQCPCGSGTCIIRNSRTSKNPNRKFYVCPAKVGSCNYFKWCDEVTMEEISSSPQFPYPKCDCGAGICQKHTEKSGPNAGRNYFICPIPKGQGACPFFQWQDTQGKTTINGDEAESKCFNSPPPTLKNRANSDLVEDGDFSVKRLKRMEIESPAIEIESPAIDTPLYTPNSMAVSDTLKRNKLSLIESREDGEQLDISSLMQFNLLLDMSENDGSVPHSATGQLVSLQTKSWGSMIEKAPKVSLLTSPAEIHRRQTEFWRQISAAGTTSFRDPTYKILGVDVQGWLGRLAFPPSRCLTIPAPKPFFCCVFPSFDFIFVPRDVDVFDNKCSTIIRPHSPMVAESDISGRLSPLTPAHKAQLSSDVLFKPSGLNSPPKAVQGNIMTGSILEAFEKAATHVQNDLLTLLESMDPHDHKAMVREANSTFDALDRLSVDYRPFYERVREFIGCVSSLAGIEQSIHNDTSSQETIDRYNCEKLRSDDLSRSYAETSDAFATSIERLQWLQEEATSVKNMLIQIENQLSSCEAETVDLETRLVKIWKEMSESKQSLQAASQEADKAQKLRELREAQRRVANEALEKARLQLRQ